MALSGIELTALTNSVMASNSAYFVHMLFALRGHFPGVDPALELAARWLALGPLALVIHRVYWNVGIWAGARAEHGLDMCTNPITEVTVDNCVWGWWAPHFSGTLLGPVALGAFGAWRAIRIIGAQRVGRMVMNYALLQVVPAGIWVYLA